MSSASGAGSRWPAGPGRACRDSLFSTGVAPQWIAAVTAVAAGAILAMIADTMIPEAFETAHDFAGLITVAGFLAAFALIEAGRRLSAPLSCRPRQGDRPMNLGRLGVWYPTDRLDAAGLTALLRLVEGHGYGTLWYPESRGYESLALAGYMLGQTRKLQYRQLDRQHLCARRLHRAARHADAEPALRRALRARPRRQPHSHGRGAARPHLREADPGDARLSRRHPEGRGRGRRTGRSLSPRSGR